MHYFSLKGQELFSTISKFSGLKLNEAQKSNKRISFRQDIVQENDKITGDALLKAKIYINLCCKGKETRQSFSYRLNSIINL